MYKKAAPSRKNTNHMILKHLLVINILLVFNAYSGIPSQIELADLNGTNGFVFSGIDYCDYCGRSVSSAGDFNGDGLDDVIIAEVKTHNCYVILGTTNYFSSTLTRESINGTNGVIINGSEYSGNMSSTSCSDAGDINGDGLDDLVIGFYGAHSYNGEVCVVFGCTNILPDGISLSALDGTNGFIINSIDTDDYCGSSVSGAGDVNGDGIDDIIIGAFGAGESYVLFGSAQGFPASLSLSTLDGSNGFMLNGIDASDYSGYSVSGAGDINGDGFDDVIIGEQAGSGHIVFGRAIGFPIALNLADLDGSNGFSFYGNSSSQSASFVSGAGDINGDGFDDIIIGGSFTYANGIYRSGRSHVVFGTTNGFSASLDVSTLNGTNGFLINGIDSSDQSGVSVSGAGDVNGDGFDDLIIGANWADPGENSAAGECYVVLGTTNGFSAAFNLSSLDGTNGFVINGIGVGDHCGTSVSGAGDVNGDGLDDLIIGAEGVSPLGQSNWYTGASYLVFGVTDFSPAMSGYLVNIDGSSKFLLEFSTIAGQTYFIQYTDRLDNPWNTVMPGIVAPSNKFQWIDPEITSNKFYRIRESYTAN
jgi:hypothetical protein